MSDLVTLADVKLYLWPGETLTSWDSILPTIISAVSEQIRREVGCDFEHTFYTAAAGPSFVVTALNNKIDFDEGGAALVGTVTAGTYTGATLATAIAAALNGAVGKALTYTCTYSATTEKFTIAAGSNFTLRWNTGANKAIDISNLIGFLDTANSTGALTYTSTRVGVMAAVSGYGTSALSLPNWPILEVISVTDEDGETYTAGHDNDYIMESFCLRALGAWPVGIGNFTVAYRAGYTTIPSDIILLCYELIARKFKTMKEKGWGESGRTMPDGSTSSFNSDGELTKAQKAVLAKYRRPIL
jgi:uncharacterized protein YaiE (UPF0345 family)